MRKNNNLDPNDLGICRRLFSYIINSLTITKGFNRDPNSDGKLNSSEIQIQFKQTEQDEQPDQYRNSTNFTAGVPAVGRLHQKKIVNIQDAAAVDREKMKGKTVEGEKRTVVLDHPSENLHPMPAHRRRPVLLNVEANINEKSDAYIRSRKAAMSGSHMEP